MEDDEEHLFDVTEEYTLDLTDMDGTTISINVPSSPNIGDVWLDTSTMNTNIYSIDNSWITIDSGSIDLSNINFKRVMFEDDMPDPQELKRMCEEYPGLEKAYENFKTVYKMVEQDWRGKQDDDSETLF